MVLDMSGYLKRRARRFYMPIAVCGVFAFISMATLRLVFESSIRSSSPSGHGQQYACLTFNGKLGNHIFQYASIYGIAQMNNLSIILGKDDDLVKYFEVPSAVIRENRDECRYFEKQFAKHCCVFEERLMSLEKGKSYLLGEYLQSWKYFRHVSSDVKKELTFKAPIRNGAKYIVEQYRQAYTARTSKPLTIVGAHIRRGDLASQQFIENDEILLTPDDYIFRAIDYFVDHFPNVLFIVCSDGMDYAKRIMKYRNVTAEFVYISPIHDFAILSSCDHVITTTGSFGWWAAYLAGGTATYWNSPIREGTFSRSEYKYDDFFLPGWTGLNGTVRKKHKIS